MKPLGSPQNWNAAINRAKGKYVLLLHHDDFFTNEDSLEKFIAPLEKDPSTEFVFARNPSIEDLSLGKSFSNIFFQRYYKETELLLAGNYIGAPSNVMLRISAVEPFHSKYKWIVDIEFYIRLFKSKKRFFYIDEKLIEIGIHEGQVSNECTTNHQILLFENIHYPIENNLKVTSVKLFDFYWRLIRNANLRSINQLHEIGFA